MQQQVQEAVEWIRAQASDFFSCVQQAGTPSASASSPDPSDAAAFEQSSLVGVVLGSGLGAFAGALRESSAVMLPYGDIPHFPASGVVGHAGQLVLGFTSAGGACAVMSGRVHYYEGHDIQQVVFPIRVLRALGVRTAVITNAAGGVNASFAPGTVMGICDHVNFTGINPLRGPNVAEWGERFPDLTQVYSEPLRQMAKEAAREANLTWHEGVYGYMAGPSFETPAEIRALRSLGVDAVGMSTVPEVVAAAHGGMKVVGISMISNHAAGVIDAPLNHQEVIDTAKATESKMVALLTRCVDRLAAHA